MKTAEPEISEPSAVTVPIVIGARRALLIGAPLNGLEGVAEDLVAMGRALQVHGFAIERCLEDATRVGILAKYEQLIADTAKGDAVVVYYSGLGGHARPPTTWISPSKLMDMQFIAPLDYHESTDGDFRGITLIELEDMLSRLTLKTDNVTVVLDCGYAAHASRDPSLLVKALPQPAPYDHLRAHLVALQLSHGRFDLGSNRSAVRIIACAPEQSAYEYEGVGGMRTSVLTESLVMALAEAGSEAASWATIIDRVRRRVLSLMPAQRPDIDGPVRRLPFATSEEDVLTSLAVTDIGDGNASLAGATLLGVQKDDEFMIMPAGAEGPDAALKIGDLRVRTLTAYTAEGGVIFSGPYTSIPVGARAHRTRVSAPALPIGLPRADPRSADLVRAMSDAPLVQIADDATPTLFEVKIDAEGSLTIHDRIGPLHAPRPGDATGIARVMADLRLLAQAAALRTLTGNLDWAINAEVDIEWGRVRDGEKTPLSTSGAVVHVGDRIYVTVTNKSQEDVYLTLIDIGVSGRISVLTTLSRSGVHVVPGAQYTLGFDKSTQKLAGSAVSWPTGLDPTMARPETILILVTSGPTDTSPLEHQGITRSARRDLASPLAQMLEQLGTSTSREIDMFDSTARYDVHTIDFDLAAVPDEGAFLGDERPEPAALYRASKGAAPMTVAVRLEEMTVNRNRALFVTGIRVDALVLTGTGDTAQPIYRAHTERFGNIHDGERLPIDRTLIYHGPAVDYLDLALWISRDADDAMDLSDMLARDLTGSEVQDALVKLGGRVLNAPHAAAAATAVGASAVIVNRAYQLLRIAVGDIMGLYRGSMLATERFGVGRHPTSGTYHAQDFSFVYTIEDAS